MSTTLSETAFQSRITDLCDWYGLRWHHETDSRRSRAGFPDLVIVGNTVIFAELKTATGRISPDQQEWADALTNAGAEHHTWRPADWPVIQARLQELRR